MAKRKKRLKNTDIPANMMILGRKIDVQLQDLRSNDDELVYGECFGHDHRIAVDIHHSGERRRLNSTLFHEAGHMVLHLTGLTEMIDAANDKLEEAIICAFETAFADHIDMFSLQGGKNENDSNSNTDEPK